MERIGDDVRPVSDILRTRVDNGALGRLIERGWCRSPGDALRRCACSRAARRLGRRGRAARSAQPSATSARRWRRSRAQPGGHGADHHRSAYPQTTDALLEVAFAEEGDRFKEPPGALARHELLQAGLSGHSGFVALQARLNVDVVGLGASAPTYYPAVGERLGRRMLLPEHAGVANAIGAVVGRVTLRRSGVVTSPAEGRYRAHLETGPEDFGDAETAMDRLETALREQALNDVKEAGAVGIQASAARQVRVAEVENRRMFVEAEIIVEASGRPRVAD